MVLLVRVSVAEREPEMDRVPEFWRFFVEVSPRIVISPVVLFVRESVIEVFLSIWRIPSFWRFSE